MKLNNIIKRQIVHMYLKVRITEESKVEQLIIKGNINE